MERIELTSEEIKVTKEYLAGEFGQFTATEEQKKHFSSVIDKAELLMDELDAYDEVGDDLIKWFWNKYKEQE